VCYRPEEKLKEQGAVTLKWNNSSFDFTAAAGGEYAGIWIQTEDVSMSGTGTSEVIEDC